MILIIICSLSNVTASNFQLILLFFKLLLKALFSSRLFYFTGKYHFLLRCVILYINCHLNIQIKRNKSIIITHCNIFQLE